MKTVREIIEEVTEEMCDKYCKYADKLEAYVEADLMEDAYPNECRDCPLNKLV